MKRWISLILSTAIYSSLLAQQCPPNIDFEMGNFNNWECRTGSVIMNGSGLNEIIWDNMGTTPTVGRQDMLGPNSTALDTYGHFPVHCPNGSGYSIKLGNDIGGHEAEGLFYTFTIPANATKFSLLYYYAVVLQDGGHSAEEQPRFRARIVDVPTQTEISCVSFDFTASGSLPGFQHAGNVDYKDWTPITIDLSSYAGQTLRLELITSDCVYQAHWGYAYVDVSSLCNGSIQGSNYCVGDTAINLKAPPGFQFYQWYSDASFTNMINNTQNLTVNPSQAGSIFPLIVTPYPGFGCLDTLYATIGTASKPPSNAGPDRTACSKQQVQLGVANNALYSYSWQPTAFVSNPSASNPVALTGLPGPTQFFVKTTDLGTGCFSYDTTVVTPVFVDTSSNATGKLIYCSGENINLNLSVNSFVSQVQWYHDNSPVGTSSHIYQANSSGNYWAQLHQFGCLDSTRVYSILSLPSLGATFTSDKEIQCTQEPVSFTNKSSVLGNGLASYLWKFSDGTTSATINTERTFSIPGTQSIKLIASLNGCDDSTEAKIFIINDCMPLVPSGFTPNNDGRNDILRPITAGVKQLKRFAIYDRYGQVVFSTSKEGESWDGMRGGAAAISATYVWVVEYIDYANKGQVRTGTVTLIR